MRLLAVLGSDVSRSLSPRLHNAAARALDLEVAYVSISCATELDFERAISAMQTLGALGANVTIPYKKRALEMCASVSPIARKIGAVNTLTFRDEHAIEGDNTDGPGLHAVLARMPDARFQKVQILGAGGAARAAGWALKERGAASIHITTRSGTPQPLAPVEGATLVVSALPKDGALARTAVERWISTADRPYVLDLAYGDLEKPSPLVTEARAIGLVASDGLEMLIEQAARSLALWTGGEVSVLLDAMRRALPPLGAARAVDPPPLYTDPGDD